MRAAKAAFTVAACVLAAWVVAACGSNEPARALPPTLASPQLVASTGTGDTEGTACVVAQGVPEATLTMSLGLTEPSQGGAPADGITRIAQLTASSLADSKQVDAHYWTFHGVSGATGKTAAALSFASADPSITSKSLLGAPLAYAGWSRDVDCSAAGGERAVSAGHVLRDAQGKLLVASAADTPSRDGELLFPEELLAEIQVRRVAQPSETCSHLQQALEFSATSTHEKVVVAWGKSAELNVGGITYVIGVTAVTASQPNRCATNNWIVYEKGFFSRG